MSDVDKRLSASLKCDAIDGDAFERGVVASQIREAIAEIRQLRTDNRKLRDAVIWERARVLYFAHAGDGMYDMEVLEESDKLKDRHMSEAEDELRAEGVIE